MSPTNNNSAFKAGGRPSSSPDDYYDDELATWLQYPIEDAFDKSYCSDPFAHWMPSSTSSGPTKPQESGPYGFSSGPLTMTMAVGAVNASIFESSTMVRSDSSTMFRSDSHRGLPEMGQYVGKDRPGNVPMLRSGNGESHKGWSGNPSDLMRPTSATGALALGAERAAGLVPQSGRDAFSKARTSLQHPRSSTQSPVKAAMQTDAALGSKTAGLHQGPRAEKFPCQTMQGGLQSTPPACPQPMAGLRMQVSNAIAMGIKGMHPNSMSPTTDHRLRNPSEPNQFQISNTQESGCSHVTEEVSIHMPSDNISASNRGYTDGNLGTRLVPPIHDAQCENRAFVCGSSETVLDGSSGGLQASTDISTREVTHTGKHKLDDSESPSEDVEGESFEVKPPRKTSSSKRNRAAEVHNLSERNRRNRINEKLKTLQELIPNSSKTDKASVLDEAIEYMKTLQLQLQMVSMRNGMTVSPMMIPVGMPHLQMPHVHSVGIGVPIGHAGMGIGMGMGMGMAMPMGAAGMGMMELSQGVTQTPHQVVPAADSHARASFQEGNTSGLQDGYRVSTGKDTERSDHSQMPRQSSCQPSDHTRQG